MPSRYQWLAGVIAAHPERTVYGRTRLQKTIKLLQRLGLPTDYPYMLHFYGPYSEGLQAEVGLLEHFELVKEQQKTNQAGEPYYILVASEDAEIPEVEPFKPNIEKLRQTEATVLELAATYDAFRASGAGHKEALMRLRRKKGSKCAEGREKRALQLLTELGLEKKAALQKHSSVARTARLGKNAAKRGRIKG